MPVPRIDAWKRQKERTHAQGKLLSWERRAQKPTNPKEEVEPVEVAIIFPKYADKFQAAADKVNLSYDVFTLAAISATTGLSLEQLESLKRSGILPAPTQFRRYQYGYADADYHLICDAIAAALEDADLEERSWQKTKEAIKDYIHVNRALYQSHPFSE